MARGNRANRSIGGAGLEQGGPNLGNDYSRDISRETTNDDTTRVVVPHNKQPKMKPEKQPASQRTRKNPEEENHDFDD